MRDQWLFIQKILRGIRMMDINEAKQWVKEKYPLSQNKKSIDDLMNLSSQMIILLYIYIRFLENEQHRLTPLNKKINRSHYCLEIDYKVKMAESIIVNLLDNGLLSINLKKLRKCDCRYDLESKQLIDINLASCPFSINFYQNKKRVSKDMLLRVIKEVPLSIDKKSYQYEITKYYTNLLGVRCHLNQYSGPDYIGSYLLTDYTDIDRKVKYFFDKYEWKEIIGIIRLSAIDAQGYSNATYKGSTRIMALRLFKHNLKHYPKQLKIGKLNFKNFILSQEIENNIFYKAIKELKR